MSEESTQGLFGGVSQDASEPEGSYDPKEAPDEQPSDDQPSDEETPEVSPSDDEPSDEQPSDEETPDSYSSDERPSDDRPTDDDGFDDQDALSDGGAPAEEKSLSDDELDDVADTAIATLQDILKYLNVEEVTIDEYEGDEGELILDITGDDLAVLIGRHGRTLDALQTIVSAVTVRKIGFRYPVVVDVEGYKNRQRQKLESIARSAANRAAGQNKSIKLRPMTPYERRLVHIALRNDSRVETASEGEGSARHVVVIPQ